MGIFGKRKQKKEMAEAAAKQMRQEALDRRILNGNGENASKSFGPYEVNYKAGGEAKGNAGKQIMVSIEEKSELSTRKYVLNPANTITIGSGFAGNDIVVQDAGIGEHHCEIFSQDDKVFIRNCSMDVRTVLYRKKESVYVDTRGMRLLSKDRIKMGQVTYQVTLMET